LRSVPFGNVPDCCAAKHLGRPTIEINPEDTEISDLVDIKLPMRAAEALDAIWKEWGREH